MAKSRWTDEEIAEFKTANPELYRLRGKVHSEVEVLVKPCTRAQWQRFLATMQNADAQKRSLALKQLLYDCLVAPDRREMDEVEERLPGLISELGNDCKEATGAAEEIEREKL